MCIRDRYLQGFGEGINQLDVSDINGGLPYIQASDEQIEKYGLIERVYTCLLYTSTNVISGSNTLTDKINAIDTDYEAEADALATTAAQASALVDMLEAVSYTHLLPKA